MNQVVHRLFCAYVLPAFLVFAYFVSSTGAVYGASPPETVDDVTVKPVIEKPEPVECTGKICYTVDEERKILKIYNRYVLYHKLVSRMSDVIERQSRSIETLKQTVKKVTELQRTSEEWNKKLYKQYQDLGDKVAEQPSSSSHIVLWVTTSVAVGFAAGIGTGVYLSK